jgi:hypothetical protein
MPGEGTVTNAPPDTPAEIAQTFWSASGRAKTAIALLGLLLAGTIIGLITTLNTLVFLRRIERGGQASTAEAERLDMWSLAVAVPTIIVQVLLIVIYLMWVYRAHLDLKLFTREPLNFTPGWAVGWWFIPFANLVQPCRVMGEIWRRSDARHGATWGTGGAPLLLVTWWIAFLVEGVLGRIVLRMSVSAEKLPELIRAAQFEIAAGIWDLVAIPLAIAVVVAIMRAQQRRRAELAAETPPLETVSP